MRADLQIVRQGLAPTRSAAQRLIARGAVRWLRAGGWTVLRKAGEDLPDDAQLEVIDDAETRWVSRGGLKLDAALAHTGIAVAGRRCLDVGQSTGGFTDVLLAHGAAEVVGVDVGHGQLSPKLRSDPRVRVIEGLNARAIGEAGLGRFDLVVGDLSFISITLVLPALARLLDGGPADAGQAAVRAAAGRHRQGRAGQGSGVVSARRTAHPARLCRRPDSRCATTLPVAIEGGDGNREFFVAAHRRAR